MQTSQKRPTPVDSQKLYQQSVQDIEPCSLSQFHILDNGVGPDNSMQKGHSSFRTYNEQFFTLESSPAIKSYMISYDSPSTGSFSANRSAFALQGSQSNVSDAHQSPDYTYGSPMSGSLMVNYGYGLNQGLRALENSLLGPDSDIFHRCSYSFTNGNSHPPSSMTRWHQMADTARTLDPKKVLVACAQALSEADLTIATCLMDLLGQMVSVSGDPIRRLGAYLLEGLRARLESSGSLIYKSLKCEEPMSSELLSYMHVLYQICPYWKFAYVSANAVIEEAMKDEPKIHIVDFQIAQGRQWMSLISALAARPGGPPQIRITGIDDSQSAHARGGGLHIVGQELSQLAKSCGVPFEFHSAGMKGCEVEIEDLGVRCGEAVAVNFPYVLHHMPDESVNTVNHRDRLLRLVKSLSPKVVTVAEQESNTNTTPFLPRFIETLDYYTAMFESIDAGCPREDKQRINAEQHCVARDIVNVIACEGPERVERHELFGKWRLRFLMAGFTPHPLNSSVTDAVKDLLKDYNGNYRFEERNGAVYLGWINRALVTFSAWKT